MFRIEKDTGWNQSIVDTKEDQVSQYEDILIETNQDEVQRKKKNENIIEQEISTSGIM